MTTRLAAAGLIATLFCVACTGVIGGAAGTGSGPTASGSTSGAGSGGSSAISTGGAGSSGGGGQVGSGGSDGTGQTGTADPTAAGPLPVQRLTAREYLNTVRDLLGDTSLEPGNVPGEIDDLSNNAFPFRQPTPVATLDATNFQQAAETLAKDVSAKLSAVLPCTPSAASAEAACASQFIATFGAKAYRRPLSATEVKDLTALYNTGRTTLALTFNATIPLLIEAMLQSPGFVYHWEVDPGATVKDGAVVQLGNYQVANRLSYFLWGTMPDAALFQAAAAGQLSTAAGVQTQAQRMLADPKAQDTAADFVDDLFDVNVLPSIPKDGTIYAMWNETLAGAMETEFRNFAVANIMGTGLLSDLLTGTKSSVNQVLAAVYGMSGITGTTPKPVTFDPTQRSGLFTLAGFLSVTGAANGSSPVRRGHAIFTRLLCGVLPDPPANVPPVQPPMAGLTTRQRFEQHDQNSCTGGCHSVMDPIGFGFEHYDGIGQYRTTDQTLPVDSTGSITLDGQKQTFSDGLGLAKLLATSPQVQNCMATQTMRYALNRWDLPADAASIQAAQAAFKAGGFDLRTLMAAVATSRTFRYRSPDTGEVLP